MYFIIFFLKSHPKIGYFVTPHDCPSHRGFVVVRNARCSETNSEILKDWYHSYGSRENHGGISLYLAYYTISQLCGLV